MREFEVKDYTPIEDGKHRGKITKIEFRDEPYEYCDIFIMVNGENPTEIKYGCPQNLTLSSKLGKLLTVFGLNLVAGQKINEDQIRTVLVNREVEFMTVTEMVLMKDKSKREFARVVDDSVKPLKVK